VVRSSALLMRSLAVAVAASALVAGGAVTAQAAGAASAPASRAVLEVRTFTGNGMGVGPSQAADGAIRAAYTAAERAGWQASQCYVRATEIRSAGLGLYSAVAELFCQR
jgi:hypothetical protein